MSEMHKNATPVQSLERALQIMNYLGTQTNGCGLRELSRQTGLNKSTVYRMLQTLCAYGYVYQDRNTEDYHLGLKILELSAQIMDGFDIRSIARPVLEDLCAVTGESVHLSVLNGLDAIYIEKIDNSQRTIRMYSQIGKHIPIYCSASGKALVAWMDGVELQQLISHIEFRPKTKYTIMSIQALNEDLAETRRQGYAVDWFEHEDSIFCIAAPIFDREKRIIAAISVSAAQWDLSMELFSKMREQAFLSARKISKYLGCGTYPIQFQPTGRDQERIQNWKSTLQH